MSARETTAEPKRRKNEERRTTTRGLTRRDHSFGNSLRDPSHATVFVSSRNGPALQGRSVECVPRLGNQNTGLVCPQAAQTVFVGL